MEAITIFTTGVSRGNPGPAAIGIYIANAKELMVSEVAETIGNATDTFAQYQAVMRGLQTLKEIYAEKTSEMQFVVKLDSELVKKQLNGESPINEPGLVPHFIEIHNLRVESFPHLTFAYIAPKLNTEATRLVKEALGG